MSARAQPAHRARVLHALGVTPWVRRAAPASMAAAVDLPGPAQEAGAAAPVACVVVLPHGCSVRELDLLGRALSAAGPSLARAARLTAREGQLPSPVPEARAYLVLGEAQAHALGRALSAGAMERAQIVLADEPRLLLGHADAKRRLWSALRNVRRALAAGTD